MPMIPAEITDNGHNLSVLLTHTFETFFEVQNMMKLMKLVKLIIKLTQALI